MGAERELGLRLCVYPSWVDRGRMTPEETRLQIALKAEIADYKAAGVVAAEVIQLKSKHLAVEIRFPTNGRMRKVDGWQTLPTQLTDQPLAAAA
jgi:hypothetical protein